MSRTVRFGWFGGGCLVGVIAGILLTLLGSVLAVTQVQAPTQTTSDASDVAAVVKEDYLNREINKRLNGNYPTGVDNLTLTGASVDFHPNNNVDLRPTFNLSLGPANLTVNATVRNQLSTKDGKLVMEMVGDPQLGNLNVPVSKLPFDLEGAVKDAMDKVNNDVIMAEVNKALNTGINGTAFSVAAVTTDENGLSIALKHQP